MLLFAAGGFLAWMVVPLLFGQESNLFRATFAALAVLVLGYARVRWGWRVRWR